MTRLLRPTLVGVFCAWTFVAAGCDGKPNVATLPVSGKVTVDDKPVTSGQVTLQPLAEKPQGVGLSAGTIGSDGTYTISTAGKPGAPAGKYKVTVTPSMMPTGGNAPPAPPFNAKYTDPAKTTLEIEVRENAPAGAYDLKLEK
jgi:hypothetical protein